MTVYPYASGPPKPDTLPLLVAALGMDPRLYSTYSTFQLELPVRPPTVHPLAFLLEQVEATLPEAQVLHSLHWQCQQTPELCESGAMDRFAQSMSQALHALTVAAGFMRRMQHGDTCAECKQGLVHNLEEALHRHGEARTALSALLQDPEVAHLPVVQALRQVMRLSDRAYTAVGEAYRRTGLAAALPTRSSADSYEVET